MSGRGAVERLDTLESWRPLLADLAPGPRPGLRLSALTASGARLAPCLSRPRSRIWSTLRVLVHLSPDAAWKQNCQAQARLEVQNVYTHPPPLTIDIQLNFKIKINVHKFNLTSTFAILSTASFNVFLSSWSSSFRLKTVGRHLDKSSLYIKIWINIWKASIKTFLSLIAYAQSSIVNVLGGKVWIKR